MGGGVPLLDMRRLVTVGLETGVRVADSMVGIVMSEGVGVLLDAALDAVVVPLGLLV